MATTAAPSTTLCHRACWGQHILHMISQSHVVGLRTPQAPGEGQCAVLGHKEEGLRLPQEHAALTPGTTKLPINTSLEHRSTSPLMWCCYLLQIHYCCCYFYLLFFPRFMVVYRLHCRNNSEGRHEKAWGHGTARLQPDPCHHPAKDESSAPGCDPCSIPQGLS